jgi:hypothetical protein
MKRPSSPLAEDKATQDFVALCAATGGGVITRNTAQLLRLIAAGKAALARDSRTPGERAGVRDNGPGAAMSLRRNFKPATQGNMEMSNSLTTSSAKTFENFEPDIRSRRQFPGSILKFNKGDWGHGKDATPLPLGAELVACMPTLTRGWQRWGNKEVTDARLGLYVKGYRPPQRHQLGDLDKDLWELDKDGKPKDPWVYINGLTLVALDGGAVYTFITGTDGGLSAINALGYAAGNVPAGFYPVVALGVDSYQHKRREFGRVKVPVLSIVRNVERTLYDRAIDAAWGSGAPPMQTPELDGELVQLPRQHEEPPPFEDSDLDPGHDPDDDLPIT